MRRPASMISRLILWSAVMLAISVPLFWVLFNSAVDKISRDIVDTRLLEFATQVRGYGVSLLAEAVDGPVVLDERDQSNLDIGAGSADVDWVWQITPDGRQPLRSSLLLLSDVELEEHVDDLGIGFEIQTVNSPLGEMRVAERLVEEPLPFGLADGAESIRVYYIVGLRTERYLGYVAEHKARLEELAYLAVIPVVVALFGLSALMISSAKRNLNHLSDAIHDYERGESDRIAGEFPGELQVVADRINALLSHNDKLVARTRKYVSKIAHDINHPLAIIKNALAGDRDDTLMARQLKRMEGLVDRYSSLARAIGPDGQSGRRTSVAAVLEDTVSGFSILYRRTPLSFAVKCDENLTYAIPQHDLEAMVSNLVSNAHKYGESEIRIFAHENDGWLSITVEDDGPGIPDDDRDVALNWGKRLDEAPPGTGFGLSIVFDIADLYQGKLRLDRSELGGLSATIDLPIKS